MKKTLRELLLALWCLPFAVAAHTDVNDYEVTQWKCWDIPVLLHKQKDRHQRFQISNVGETAVHWWFMTMDPLGDLFGRIDYVTEGGSWGELAPFRTVYVTNSAIQEVEAPERAPEEGVGLCFRNGNEEPRGRFEGYVSVREMRWMHDHWVGFDITLTKSWEWWSVLPKVGVESKSTAQAVPKRQGES